MAEIQNAINLEDMFDEDFDITEMADGNVILLAGTHRGVIHWGAKAINIDNTPTPVTTFDFTLIETLQLSETEEGKTPQKPGTKAETLFKKDGGMSEAQHKRLLKQLSSAAGSTKALEIMNATNGWEVIVQTSTRVKKGHNGAEDRTYMTFENIEPAA